jgi:hypothetical protein
VLLLPAVVPALLAVFVACRSAPEADPDGPAPRWFRGNTHTHTLWSDGDAAPELAVDWYASHGYDFLVLSDHNILAEGDFWRPVGDGYKEARPALVEQLRERFGEGVVQLRERQDGVSEMRLATLGELRARFERPGGFLLVTGEEISDVFDGRPIHHNALNLGRRIDPPGGESVPDLMRRTLRLIAEEGQRTGQPVLGHLNHPNYEWAVTPDDIAAVHEERFFEVYNGHRLVRNEGDADHAGTEALWDHVLTLRLAGGGPPLYALATDDAHDFLTVPGTANPGRGWIVVRAEELTAAALLRAMAAGDFYASSGVRLRDVRADRRTLTVEVDPEPGVTYLIRFLGTRRRGETPARALRAGEVLAERTGPSATYRFHGDELYVRATVVSSRRHRNGYSPEDRETAWVQPLVPGRPAAAPAGSTSGVQ